jgi:cytochrome c2
MFFIRSMVGKFVFWSVVFLALVGFTAYSASWNNQNARTRDFNYWQGEYAHVAYTLATDPAVKQATLETPIEVKQVTVGQFPIIEQDGTTQQRVDRCESCHVGLDNPQMTAENIIKVVDGTTVATDQVANYLEAHPNTRAVVETIGAHPGILDDKNMDMGVAHSSHLMYGVATNGSPTAADKAQYDQDKVTLKQHPFATFGCTLCHYGSGRDLVQYKAHQFVGDEPLADIPESANIVPTPGMQMLPAKYMEAACAQCHATYSSTDFTIKYLPSMTKIARGEELFKKQACYGCHKIDGFSKGNIGPELTDEGRTTGGLPVNVAHQLWDPRYKTAACVMPYFFSVRAHNTDDPDHVQEIVDDRARTVQAAAIENQDTRASLVEHGYVADASRQDDVDALVTFIVSQTGENFTSSQSSRFAAIAAYNAAGPADVPVTVDEGKLLFASSGCPACHYIGNPNVKHVVGDPAFGQGGMIGPELSWEGTRHSQAWLVEHYKNPQEFVPTSIMPIFPLSDTERAALATYDQTLRPNKPGARTVSPDQDMPSMAFAKAGITTPDVRYMIR